MKAKRILFITMSLLIMFYGVALGISFQEGFERPSPGFDPYSDPIWKVAGDSSGSFGVDSGYLSLSSAQLADTAPGFSMPALASYYAQYFDLSNASISALVRCNNGTGTGGVSFSVYDASGTNVSALIGAALQYDNATSQWSFVLFDQDEYTDQYIIDTTAVLTTSGLDFDASQFHEISLVCQNGTCTATLDGGNTLTGAPSLPIPLGWGGIFANDSGNFSFDEFQVIAEPDNRHTAFDQEILLTDTTTDEMWPSWSPDGEKLAFIRRDTTNPAHWNICVRQHFNDPASEVQITQNSDNLQTVSQPKFSPDSAYVLFSAPSPLGWSAIKRAKADGTGVVETVLTSATSNRWVGDISATRKLLFGTLDLVVGPQPWDAKRDLFAVQITDDGMPIAGTQKTLTNFPVVGNYQGPYNINFDQAQGRLVFARFLSIWTADIYLLNDVNGILSGTSSPPAYSDPLIQIVASNSHWKCTPFFSRDGTSIYYAEDTLGKFNFQTWTSQPWLTISGLLSGAHFEIFTTNLDTGEKIALNYYRPYSQGYLSPSPDGSNLLFQSDKHINGAIKAHIYLVPVKAQGYIEYDTGGTIEDQSGAILDVPAGSITGEITTATTISIKTPLSGDIPSPATLPPNSTIALAREITVSAPESLTVNPDNPPELTIQYTDEEIAGLDEATLNVYVYNEDTMTWEPLTIVDRNIANNTITAELPHFSIFVLAGTPPPMTTVPNVTYAIWREEASAEGVLNAFGFQVTKVYEHSITVLNGFAIRTDPPAGTQVPVGSPVTLYISSGPDKVIMPNLIGLTEAQAQTLITSSRLVLFNTSREYSNQPVGQVIGQSPDAGLSVDPGRLVGISVSKGPQATTTVPNVINAIFREEAIAEWILTANGFQVTKVYEHSTTVPKGLAIRTNPPAGSVVPINSAVTLVISSGR